MSKKLHGKTAIVTGGSAGIGKALAVRLANDGANIAIIDKVISDVVIEEIKSNGVKVIAVQADISTETDVAGAIEQIVAVFHGVDILVNNAAMTAKPGPFEEIGSSEWRRMMDVNTLGPYLLCRAVVPYMRSANQGRIINIVSDSALSGAPNMLHYVSSKGAVIAFTRALARELGKSNITVNALAPGFTLVDRLVKQPERVDAFRRDNMKCLAIPRDQLPEDIAGAVSFLASSDSSFVTGQTIIVDGGLVMN